MERPDWTRILLAVIAVLLLGLVLLVGAGVREQRLAREAAARPIPASPSAPTPTPSPAYSPASPPPPASQPAYPAAPVSPDPAPSSPRPSSPAPSVAPPGYTVDRSVNPPAATASDREVERYLMWLRYAEEERQRLRDQLTDSALRLPSVILKGDHGGGELTALSRDFSIKSDTFRTNFHRSRGAVPAACQLLDQQYVAATEADVASFPEVLRVIGRPAGVAATIRQAKARTVPHLRAAERELQVLAPDSHIRQETLADVFVNLSR